MRIRRRREGKFCLNAPLVRHRVLSEVGWNAILSWNPQDNMLLYASLGRGFKGGALDNRALANGDNPIDPEFLDSVELGFKSLLADGRVSVQRRLV